MFIVFICSITYIRVNKASFEANVRSIDQLGPGRAQASEFISPVVMRVANDYLFWDMYVVHKLYINYITHLLHLMRP